MDGLTAFVSLLTPIGAKLVLRHSGHWGINPPQKHPFLSCQAPLLNQQTVQALPFYAMPPYILVFQDPLPLKVRSFSEPPKY